ncbi:uncharacterized protein G2W53_010761 [Senna tora]|uniref:Uncharacterized protein n=1 Tax=Senna tora TaxID=362788 RepID=A0A834X1L8_9FABA|nr:uncharacterized protein G2W53_010761 [Senna tora]
MAMKFTLYSRVILETNKIRVEFASVRCLRPILVPLNNDEIDKEVDEAHQNFRCLRPILVPLNNDEIDKEVDQAHQRKQLAKVVEIVTINIIPNQPFTTVSNTKAMKFHALL